MNRVKIFFILLIIFSFYIGLSAQNKLNDNSSSYISNRDSLSLLKQKLKSEKSDLLKSLDSLKAKSNEIDADIEKTKNDISTLYVNKFGNLNGKRIANKQVWKGMSDKMLQLSWGKPDKINKNVEKWGTFTQWYYGDVTFFFKNGLLIDWEEIKQ